MTGHAERYRPGSTLYDCCVNLVPFDITTSDLPPSAPAGASPTSAWSIFNAGWYLIRRQNLCMVLNMKFVACWGSQPRTGGGCDVEAGVPLLHDPLLAQELVGDLIHLRGRRCKGSRGGNNSSEIAMMRQILGSHEADAVCIGLVQQNAQHARRMRPHTQTEPLCRFASAGQTPSESLSTGSTSTGSLRAVGRHLRHEAGVGVHDERPQALAAAHARDAESVLPALLHVHVQPVRRHVVVVPAQFRWTCFMLLALVGISNVDPH